MASPEDFRVDEVPLYAPSGEGGHTFLHVEKRCRSTEEVARALARAAGVPPRDVGYAGRKDRFAVTTQWFSVPGLAPEQARRLELPDARILDAAAHPHKLRTGQLRANRFAIALRDPSSSFEAMEGRLASLVERGMPNRFGEQRFGREGDNAERGRKLLAGELRVRDRREARFLVSAFQAEVFNAVLADRAPELAQLAQLARLERGDVAVVHESGGLFLVEDPEREAPRAAAFEISATGPIFGTRMRRPEGVPGEREQAVLAAHGLEGIPRPPRGIRLRGGRRPLRVQPEEARLEALPHGDGDRDGVRLEFTLPPGSYATVLLEELLARSE